MRAVRTSSEPLGFHDLVAETLDVSRAVLAEAGGDVAALQRLDLEQDLADLLVLDARMRIAAALRAIPVRETAGRAGLTPGYLSELRNMSKAKGGLPSPDAAARLDQALGLTDEAALAEIVRTTKADLHELKVGRDRWRADAVPPRQAAYDPAVDRRIVAIAEAARRDEVVARATELLTALPARERRAVLRLLEELTGS